MLSWLQESFSEHDLLSSKQRSEEYGAICVRLILTSGFA
jgi:hypothetical protein